MAKKGLGKGLDALFMSDLSAPSDAAGEGITGAVANAGTSEIKITDIDPNKNQPRKLFYDDSLEELAESIRLHGILQPLALRRVPGGRFQIIA